MGADKSLLILLLFLVTFVQADVSCALKEYKVAHFNGTSWCIDCPSCPAGQELSPPCGSTISTNELSECKVCPTGFFSAVSDVWSCRTCGSCADEDQQILKNCTADSDILCAKQCKSNDSYYDNKGDCMPCSPCCGDDEDVRVKECEQKLGSQSDKICAFQSNYDRCKKPTTPHSSSLPSKAYSSSTGEPRQVNSSTSTGRRSTNMPQVPVTTKLVKDPSASLTAIPPRDTLSSSQSNRGGTYMFNSTTDQSSNSAGDRDTIIALVPPAVIVILLGIVAVISICKLLKHSCDNHNAVLFHKTSSSDGTGNLEQLKITGREETVVILQPLQVTHNTDSTGISNGGAKHKSRCSLAEVPLIEKDTGASSSQGSHKHGQTDLLLLRQLKSVSLETYERVWKRLDKELDDKKNRRGCYKEVAEEFGYEQEDIWEFEKELRVPGRGSPSRALLEGLETKKPELTVTEFIQVLKLPHINRDDIIEILCSIHTN